VVIAMISIGLATAQVPPVKDAVVATVNGRKIPRTDLEIAAKYKLEKLRQGQQLYHGEMSVEAADVLGKQANRETLNDLIDRELLIAEFERLAPRITIPDVEQDIDRLMKDEWHMDRAALLTELKEKGISWLQFRDKHRSQLIVKAMHKHVTDAVVSLTPEQKESFLRQHEQDFIEGGSATFKTIAVPQQSGEGVGSPAGRGQTERQHIEDIRRRLVAGADFSAEARAWSQDSKAPNGGDWGTQLRTSLAPELATIVFSLPLNTLSAVTEFRGFYYLILVEARVPGKLKPMVQIDKELSARALANLKSKTFADYLSNLRRQAKITYADPALRLD
jgi:parvulin-like peptidyl-prolyl isomerase